MSGFVSMANRETPKRPNSCPMSQLPPSAASVAPAEQPASARKVKRVDVRKLVAE